MYELVKKILDFSKERKVNDVLIGCDMYASENGGYTDEIKMAKKIIDRHYDFIVKCRRENDEELLKAFFGILETGTGLEIENFKEENNDD